MGLEIDRERFTPADFARFRDRLERSLVVLRRLLERDDFGQGAPTLGAELEVSLIDSDGRPLPKNRAVLSETADDRMTFELDRFNLEGNLEYAPLNTAVFDHLYAEVESARAELSRAAAVHGGRIATIGILPTLIPGDLTSEAMTDSIRYRALSRSLRERREGPFELSIDGADPLIVECDDVTFEGAATSFQLHLKVGLADFAAVFDAAQVATAPVLAVAGNSPTFLGHRLWDETRVALFKQAVDDRDVLDRLAGKPSRVGFGLGWVREGPIELFERAVSHYTPLLPVIYDEDPEEELETGGIPTLGEIRLHQGTVWHWNRPVYDPHGGGHVRLEMRALPTGPTTRDMVANAAFMVGLALGLAPDMGVVRAVLPFAAAESNFYRAAKEGLDANLVWLGTAGSPEEVSATDLIPKLLPTAAAGLERIGLSASDSRGYLDVIAHRVDERRTGALWQRERLSRLGSERPDPRALRRMFSEYQRNSEEGRPVHEWSVK